MWDRGSASTLGILKVDGAVLPSWFGTAARIHGVYLALYLSDLCIHHPLSTLKGDMGFVEISLGDLDLDDGSFGDERCWWAGCWCESDSKTM